MPVWTRSECDGGVFVTSGLCPEAGVSAEVPQDRDALMSDSHWALARIQYPNSLKWSVAPKIRFYAGLFKMPRAGLEPAPPD